MRDVTVGMATFDDDPAIFALALDAALAQVEQPVVVADMSRGNEIRAAAAARGARVRYLAATDSAGLSDSRNRIVAAAVTRYLAFLDADAVPEPGWAAALRAAFERDDRVAVAGARSIPVWPRRPPPLFETQTAGDYLSMLDLGPSPKEVPRIVGTSFALDRERLPAGPPFSLELGRRPDSALGGEEVDFCERVRAAGWRVVYEPDAVVKHHVRRGRDSWRWMLRRAYLAGREARRAGRRFEPLPRRLGARDVLFLAAIAPAFAAGRLSERRRRGGSG